MSDYIKREDAIKSFDPLQIQDWYTPWIVETLEDLPSADVAPVRHGRWMDMKGFWMCSECHKDTLNLFNYCPYCGAKMDGDADD